MSVQHRINIKKGRSDTSVSFEPSLLEVRAGDQIFWHNTDSQPHWLGLKQSDGTIDRTFFMPAEIAPSETSILFSPATEGNLNYACFLHPDETGTISVRGKNGGGGIGPH